MTRNHSDTGELQIIWASGKYKLEDSVTFPVRVPNGEWLLQVMRSDGWHSPPLTLAWMIFAVVVMAVLSAFLAFQALLRPLQLSREVASRTAALNLANESLQSEIIEHWQTEMALRDSEQRLEHRVLAQTKDVAVSSDALAADKNRISSD